MDEYLRRLERKFRETGDIEDGKRWVRAVLAAESETGKGKPNYWKYLCPQHGWVGTSTELHLGFICKTANQHTGLSCDKVCDVATSKTAM